MIGIAAGQFMSLLPWPHPASSKCLYMGISQQSAGRQIIPLPFLIMGPEPADCLSLYTLTGQREGWREREREMEREGESGRDGERGRERGRERERGSEGE